MLTTVLGWSATQVTGVLLVAQLGVFAGFVATGTWGQSHGRRRALVARAGVSATVGLGVYGAVLSGRLTGMSLVVAVVAAEVLILAVWGVVTSYCTERFITAVRASGFGIGYSLALVPASFYVYYLAGLDALMPYRYTPLVLLAVGGLLAVAGALSGPETRDTDLADPG